MPATDLSKSKAPNEELHAALAAAMEQPADGTLWDATEDRVATHQTPEPVAAAYAEVLGRSALSAPARRELADRALRFVEEWFSDEEAPALAVLQAVFALDPTDAELLERVALALTSASQWAALMDAYDRALEAIDSLEEQARLLSDAARVAKDVVGDERRAASYLSRLLPLRPGDAQLRQNLERLLEKGEQWSQLIELWTGALPDVAREEAAALSVRIADCWLDRLHNTPAAVEVLLEASQQHGDDPAVCAALERVVSLQGESISARSAAFARVRDLHREAGRKQELARVLRAGAALEEGEARAASLRELAKVAEVLGDPAEVLECRGQLLAMAPADESLLEPLAEAARDADAAERHVALLLAAASDAPEAEVADALRGHAARAAQAAGLRARAVEIQGLLQRSGHSVAAQREAGEALLSLLRGEDGDTQARVEALQRQLALVEGESSWAERVLELARVHEARGEVDDALEVLQLRLSRDPLDAEALDTRIEVLRAVGRHTDLVEGLRRRVARDDASKESRARDLAEAAATLASSLGDLPGAVASWRQLAELDAEAFEAAEAAPVAKQRARAAFDEAAEVQVVVGDALRELWADAKAALEHHLRALRMRPSDEHAQRALRAMLAEPELRGLAADALGRAFRDTGDVEGQLEVLEARAEGESSAARRRALWLEAAALAEGPRNDATAAFEHTARAFACMPEDPGCDDALARLSEVADRRAERAACLAEARAQVEAGPRAQWLAEREAELREALGEAVAARDLYAALHGSEPSHEAWAFAACRLALATDAAALSASTLVDHAVARGQLPGRLVSLCEGESGSAPAALCAPLAEALAEADLPGDVATTLWKHLGRWAEARKGDTALVERAWAEAHRLQPSDEESLRHLVQVRRERPDAHLFESLMAWAGVLDDPREALEEAARLAVERLADVEAQKRALTALLDHATSARAALLDAAAARRAAVWAVGVLAELHEREGDTEALLAVLGRGAAIVPAGDDTLELGLRAAELAASHGAEAEITLGAYRRLFEQRPDHLHTARALAALLEEGQRDEELLVVLQRALAAAPREARGELRLWTSRVLGRIESRDPRVAVLQDNLRDTPGDATTLDALEQVLRDRGAIESWHKTLMDQAAMLRSEGDAESARVLYERAAVLARDELSDPRRALAGFKQVAELAPEPRVFGALAALHEQRGEPARAQVWLTRLLEAKPDDRDVRLRLAAALEASESYEAAEVCLREGVEGQPASLALRQSLADLLERQGKTRALADLLATTVQHVKDPEQAAAHTRRAAALYAELGVPEAGVDMLEQALELLGDERDLQLAYADASIAAGGHERARAMLENMVEAYGRRRSPERAELHLRLARVARAAGDTEQALAQLDLAAGMSRNDVATLVALAGLAEEAGEWDRAEKALRALLLLVRRAEEEGGSVCTSEVQFALHRIAKARGQDERAEELLQSAFEAAVQSEWEARLFKESLLRQGEPELLLQVLEKRLAHVADAATEARVLADLADVLEGPLERGAEALDARLKALRAAPSVTELHDGALATAERLSALDRYVETLGSLLERARRRDDEQEAGLIGLRLGQVLEKHAGDVEQAREAYARVPRGSRHHIEAQLGLARVAGGEGDRAGERAVLEGLLEDDSIGADDRMRVEYRLVALAGAESDETARDVALDTLQSLLQRYPGSHGLAASVLEGVIEAHPGDGRALSLLEEVCRQANDAELLLRFLERHAQLADASLDLVREGAELAREREQNERAERLFERAVELAEEGPGLASAVWAAVGLATLAREHGDAGRALQWLKRAVDVAEGDEGFLLGLDLAQLASAQDQATVARETYLRLMEREPGDRRVYRPLLQLCREAKDLAGFAEATAQVTGALLEAAERNELRMDLALFANESQDAELAEGVLRQALEDDPEDEACALLLADMLEQQGRKEDLADLLGRELEAAHAARNPSIAPLSLRMGSLLADSRPDDALQVYRTALSIVPGDPGLLHASVELLDPVAQAAERARLVERLLSNDAPEDAPELAHWLIDHATNHGDEADLERALSLAFRVIPDDEGLRERLEQWHRERENWAGLCDMLAVRGEHAADPERAVELFSEAAELALERLGDHERAASLLRTARAHAPNNASLLRLSILALVRAGQVEQAMQDVDAALTEAADDAARAGLHQVRGEAVAEGGDPLAALADFERAYALGGAPMGAALLRGLERAQVQAKAAEDAAREREVVMRALEVADGDESLDAPLATLDDWVKRHTDDVDAALSLTSRRLAAGQPAEAMAAAELVIQSGELEQAHRAADMLVHAAQGLEQPASALRGLEAAMGRFAGDARLRDHLASVYEAVGADEHLAALLLDNLPPEDDTEGRFEVLRRVGALYLRADQAREALPVLEQALALKPDDTETRLWWIDACIGIGEYQGAQAAIEAGMEGIRARRSPELAELRKRMAVLCDRAGDQQARYEWMAIALEADMNNGDIAAETAILAQQLGEVDVALKALRAVTMAKAECSMSRAEAFLRQAQIVAHKGETRRAALWAKKARAEDPEFPGVDELLAELGA